jgi:hypothetical protein
LRIHRRDGTSKLLLGVTGSPSKGNARFGIKSRAGKLATIDVHCRRRFEFQRNLLWQASTIVVHTTEICAAFERSAFEKF